MPEGDILFENLSGIAGHGAANFSNPRDTQTSQGKGNQLQTVVDLLRAREVSWADIWSALGVSGHSAWERFGL